MAWLNKLNSSFQGKRSLLLSAALLAALVASGCNVGKTDTVAGVTGTSTSGGTTGGGTGGGTAKSGCAGSYVGNYGPPERDERIRLRNLSLTGRGIAVTGNDAIDNANAGGGDPDGGIWMGGSYNFQTDGNCNVISGTTLIFYAYEYNISGTVNKDGSFNLIWSGQGSQGDMKGQIDANNNITGQFFHPPPDNFVYGVLSGQFTPTGK
jgi:hypothetical protein